MRLETAYDFVDCLSGMRFADVFNPYSDICAACDLPQAPDIRRCNLVSVLDSILRNGVATIWIGRDLGYRGGRRTGLALTDELHLVACAELLGSRPLHRATHGPAIAEPTARIVWDLLNETRSPVLLWNVFPFHPHSPEHALTNRTHTRMEAEACHHLLAWLLERLAPRYVVAIGGHARSTLGRLDIEALAVRHPSYGGKADFLSSMRDFRRSAEVRSGERSTAEDFKDQDVPER
ncbi:uracil-DNA glycosylase [Rhizobiaceae bacterium n13]|uniref:Uracil-DNA glycosylase n=1 Tax=Ferirhizobium litorale TaxID=2927786 RepID=A0AAE3QC01_9HYPH|nr:uracil-DNA glycosylase [Fererhizobium litorale]MDI7860692.1 uracil-DNA glycosylase [Fererhizobium litorale]MDI7920840.1 uracil-DNA glycosylase [Fererhizobium litorale]